MKTGPAIDVSLRNLTGGFELVGPGGRTILREIEPGIIIQTFEGRLSTQLLDASCEWYQRAIDAGYLLVLAFDNRKVSTYDPDVRKRSTEWFTANADNIEDVLILTGPPLMKLAIRTFNTVSRAIQLKQLDDVEDFQAGIAAAVARLKARGTKRGRARAPNPPRAPKPTRHRRWMIALSLLGVIAIVAVITAVVVGGR